MNDAVYMTSPTSTAMNSGVALMPPSTMKASCSGIDQAVGAPPATQPASAPPSTASRGTAQRLLSWPVASKRACARRRHHQPTPTPTRAPAAIQAWPAPHTGAGSEKPPLLRKNRSARFQAACGGGSTSTKKRYHISSCSRIGTLRNSST